MRAVLSLVVGAIALAACGGADADSASDGRPTIVVSTSILGDIARNVAGDEADVEVILPIGSDPHEFSPSARQAESIEAADLLVVNGAGLEPSLQRIVDRGEDVFTFADHVELRQLDGSDDPHLWNDPHLVAGVVPALGAAIAGIDGVDADAVTQQATAYARQLEALDAEITETLAPIPAGDRKLVTNHRSFGHFAARYDLDVVGTVVPSSTTGAAASAGDLEQLADVVRQAGVPAIFAETTQPTKLAETLAAEVGSGVAVVELYTESLGEPGSGADTYIGMLRTDTQRIAGALA